MQLMVKKRCLLKINIPQSLKNFFISKFNATFAHSIDFSVHEKIFILTPFYRICLSV